MDTLAAQLEIKLNFPDAKQFVVTSPETEDYNCIAWAAGENDRWWWPDRLNQKYWPKNAPREETLDAFIQAFSTKGFIICPNGDYESGFEKIAIYVGATGKPTHAARLLPDGWWTSKLGASWDISHVLAEIGGFRVKSYGKIASFMKRAHLPPQ